MNSVRWTWQNVIIALRQHHFGTLIRMPTALIDPPIDVGMIPAIGVPLGQLADYIWRVDEYTTCHVTDFGGYYDVRLALQPIVHYPLAVAPPHLPSISPYAPPAPPPPPPPAPAINDAGAAVLATTAIGALLGMLGGTKQSVTTGALLGGVFGLAAVAVSNAEDSPATSEAAASMANVLAKLAQVQEAGRAREAGRKPALEIEFDPTERLNTLREKRRALEQKQKEDATARLTRLLNASSLDAPGQESVARKQPRKRATSEPPARGRNKKSP